LLQAGDVICFNKDIINPMYRRWGLTSAQEDCILGSRVIRKDIPILLVRITKAHVIVKYDNVKIKLRRVDSRMYKASEAAQVLYGDLNVNK